MAPLGSALGFESSRVQLIGPASFVVNPAVLTPATVRNLLAKYADGTYLIVPATNVDIVHSSNWTILKRLTT